MTFQLTDRQVNQGFVFSFDDMNRSGFAPPAEMAST